MVMQDCSAFASQLPPLGRLACLDLGEKRIGVALSDPSRMIASPFTLWQRETGKKLNQQITGLCTEEQLSGLIIGLPQTLAGQDSKQTQRVRAMADNIAKHVAPLPVLFWDERMSSRQATSALTAVGVRKSKQKEKVDAAAAAYILQGVLDFLAFN